MSKEKGGDEEEVPKYKNSPAQELESWKQIQHKIDVSFHKTAEKEFESYAQRLQEKNTYFNNTKHPEINSKDIADDKMRTIKKFSGEIVNEHEENDYCIYCTSRITPCPHRRKRVDCSCQDNSRGSVYRGVGSYPVSAIILLLWNPLCHKRGRLL